VQLDEHLFRREAPRMVAALTRIFGVHNLALAEDVVQEAFQRALELWAERGVPDNPAAWLMTAAKNRAVDLVRRERTARRFAPEMGQWLDSEWSLVPLVDEAFSSTVIRDAQLRMMFSCCHPALPEGTQLALVLNLLCGFGAAEIAAGLLVGRAAIEKRITRGKAALADASRLFDLTDADFAARLATVQRALYLLFNEGYHGASPHGAVRQELCAEAMRLVALLRDHAPSATPATHALAALMCLHAARLPARISDAGELASWHDQDRSHWDTRLVIEGLALFEQSSTGDELTPYHLEAALAATHAAAPTTADTDWDAIVVLYDQLLALAPSPMAALGRAIAIGERDGPDAGLAALRAITERDRLTAHPAYAAAFAELELARGDRAAARVHFEAARALARNDTERRFLERRLLDSCPVGADSNVVETDGRTPDEETHR
jgi:predicted RNA polymerase sigma factor